MLTRVPQNSEQKKDQEPKAEKKKEVSYCRDEYPEFDFDFSNEQEGAKPAKAEKKVESKGSAPPAESNAGPEADQVNLNHFLCFNEMV